MSFEISVTVNAPALAEAMAALAAALQSNPIAPLQIGAEVTPPPSVAPVAPATVPSAPVTAPAAPAVPFEAPHIAPYTPPPVAPAVTPAPPVTPPSVPVTAAPAFTHEQIMAAGAALIDSGKINELMGLLNAFGVQAVTQLKQEQLGAFATEMRKLGAQL
jgi:hypothetical protein